MIWDFPARMGGGRAVASGAVFQGLAKADVELGRVICAPPRVHGPMDPFERCEFDNIISSMPWAFMLDDFGFAEAIFRPGHCIVAAVSDAAR